ncbi:high affinity cAMP-specific and IBMX-insensitive 3',5'-cyclic phosphodiesterase 8-like [Teleopsis dalmanni]|uniref:high affinity cAMP-specific and IBMX-insensitive 3',5'-cyclic phosphodiesterase 8-like n=1 Tax=Teleopsis dalmanni TaxID=139649 RepID=UPI0018CED0B9|nr:high affinity cAMP-specific and IBMX-insensitive 3',5'-cyclic phosphodiesterase 8-like [Teleopsis dalmanni]
MGCSPSTLATSTAPDVADTNQTMPRATPITEANEKDDNLFFCIKFRRSRLRRCSQQNGADGSAGSTGSALNGDDLLSHAHMCNQSLLNPTQTKNEADYEKVVQWKDTTVEGGNSENYTKNIKCKLFCSRLQKSWLWVLIKMD